MAPQLIMSWGLGLALLLAMLIGVSLGLLGSGGSIITLPVLVYVAGVPVTQAVGMSLVIVGGSSAFGCYLHGRHGAFAAPAALYFCASGMAGSFFGAKLTHLVSGDTLMILFSSMMILVGATMLQNRERPEAAARCRPARCVAVGAAVGLLTGFLGVGGGLLILPALVLFAGVDIRKAVGTSLAVIALNCGAGALGQMRYATFNGWLTLAFLAMAIVGMLVGTRVSRQLSPRSLRRGFGGFILVIGLVLAATTLARMEFTGQMSISPTPAVNSDFQESSRAE